MTSPSLGSATDRPFLPAWFGAAAQPLLYGLRLSAAVALALFIAFTLQLDNPSWAGTSAAIVCQPILGASLRKGFFRAVGTVTGAVMAVVLTGAFPQNRVGFLFGMALWAAVCSFGGTLTRNFAAYAFALSGYTLAIIAGDSISAPDQVFVLAVTRASEIVIGIACGTLVMSLTDLGQSRGKLDVAMDRLSREIASCFTDLLGAADIRFSAGPELRRSLILRVAQLDLLIDQAIGESPELRHRGAILQAAMAGLFAALSGWRIAESHLGNLAPDLARYEASTLVGLLPSSWTSAEAAAPGSDPFSDLADDRRDDLAAVRALSGLPATGVSRRLLADAASNMALGLTAAANGLALLRDPANARDPVRVPGFVVTDVLPALVNAIRVFLAIGAVILFWIVTEWPNGLNAVTFTAVTVLLLSPQAERSGRAAFGFGVGAVLAACLAAVTNFALLPNREGFLSLALVIGAVLTPLAALSTLPALAPYLVAATMNFVPLLGPTNAISFDTVTFYNAALGDRRRMPRRCYGPHGDPAGARRHPGRASGRPHARRPQADGVRPMDPVARRLAEPRLRPPRGNAGGDRHRLRIQPRRRADVWAPGATASRGLGARAGRDAHRGRARSLRALRHEWDGAGPGSRRRGPGPHRDGAAGRRRRRGPPSPHRYPAGQGRRPTASHRLRRNRTMIMRTTRSASQQAMLEAGYPYGDAYSYPHRWWLPMVMPIARSWRRVRPLQTTMLPGGGS